MNSLSTRVGERDKKRFSSPSLHSSEISIIESIASQLTHRQLPSSRLSTPAHALTLMLSLTTQPLHPPRLPLSLASSPRSRSRHLSPSSTREPPSLLYEGATTLLHPPILPLFPPHITLTLPSPHSIQNRFNLALKSLPESSWEQLLTPVFIELCYNLESFNPAFTSCLLMVQVSLTMILNPNTSPVLTPLMLLCHRGQLESAITFEGMSLSRI